MSPCYTSGCWMTCWARPNPACKHNGCLMMWVRLMGGYHWRSCTAAGHRTLASKYQEWKEGNDWVWSMVTMGTRGGEKSLPHTRKQWNTCSVAPYTPTHLKDKNPALRVDVCVVSCTHDSMEQILCVLCVILCVCVFFLWSYNSVMQQLHTRRHWHSSLGWMVTDARSNTAPLTLGKIKMYYYLTERRWRQ